MVRRIALTILGVGIGIFFVTLFGRAFPPEVSPTVDTFVPVLKSGETVQPEISARSAGLYYINESDAPVILFGKNATTATPIASVTKLMLARAVIEQYAQIDVLEITSTSLEGKGGSGFFEVGEKFYFPDFLNVLLVESNNDVARLLAERGGEVATVLRMNEIAEELGMLQTQFRTPTGLDLNTPHEASNVSSPHDLALLMFHLLYEYPEILDITTLPEFELRDSRGALNHVAKSTNKLLSDASLGIIGGKTGDTPLAGKNLVVAFKLPNNRGIGISVVLGSQDHFADTKTLIEWARNTYEW